MTSLVSRIVPRAMVPAVRIAARKLRGRPANDIFSAATYRSLSALKCSIGYNEHGGYCVPESSRHRPASRAVHANEVWEPYTIAFMQERCGTGDIVHAGTFFGDFLPGLARAMAPGAKVWAFEPSVENYRCARITMEINALLNVELTRAALGATRGQLNFRTHDGSGGALGGAAKIAEHGDEKVDVMRIDDVVEGRDVSIIQLDVEGYEKAALEGARKTIERCRPVLIIESTDRGAFLASAWFHDNIAASGYRRSREIHDNVVFEC